VQPLIQLCCCCCTPSPVARPLNESLLPCRVYTTMFPLILDSLLNGGVVQGTNFWVFNSPGSESGSPTLTESYTARWQLLSWLLPTRLWRSQERSVLTHTAHSSSLQHSGQWFSPYAATCSALPSLCCCGASFGEGC